MYAFDWWDDAVAFARGLASDTRLRQKVTGDLDEKTGARVWVIDLADNEQQATALRLVGTEPCS